MEELKELEERMKAVMAEARECIDFSFDIMAKNPNTKKIIYKHWENFLVHFFNYVVKRDKNSGQDFLKEISIRKLMKFF
ncbi:MAG: hypothetical protein K0S71_2959 [Clostridia bacterium]|jgi:hypothetical protein|nr:hypothetical protein [Clostridia bacterium]